MAAINLGAALAAEIETRPGAAVDAHLHGITGHQTTAVIADIDLAGISKRFWIDEFDRRKIQALRQLRRPSGLFDDQRIERISLDHVSFPGQMTSNFPSSR